MSWGPFLEVSRNYRARYRRLHLPVNARAKKHVFNWRQTSMFQVSNFEVSPPKLKLTWPQTSVFQVSNFEISPHISGFSHIFWTTMTVNHKSTDSVERTSRLGGKNSKFDTWNIDVWDHASLSLGGKTSKFDTWNIDVWRQLKTCF